MFGCYTAFNPYEGTCIFFVTLGLIDAIIVSDFVNSVWTQKWSDVEPSEKISRNEYEELGVVVSGTQLIFQ